MHRLLGRAPVVDRASQCGSFVRWFYHAATRFVERAVPALSCGPLIPSPRLLITYQTGRAILSHEYSTVCRVANASLPNKSVLNASRPNASIPNASRPNVSLLNASFRL